MYKYGIKYYKDLKYTTLGTIRKKFNHMCGNLHRGNTKRPYTYEEFKNSIPEDIRNMFSEQVIIDAYYHDKSVLQTNVDQDKTFDIHDFTALGEETHYRIRHFRPRVLALPSKSLTTQQMHILESLNISVHEMHNTISGFNLKGTIYVN